MSRVLESVREEIADVEARLEKLRHIEEIAVALNGGVPEAEPLPEIPKPPAAPRPLPPAARRLPAARVRAQRPKPSGQGRDGLSANAVKVLELVREVGEIKPNEVSTRLALSPAQLKKAVKTLIDRGLIDGYGSRAGRVYKAPQGPGQARIAAKPTQTRKKADPKGGSVQGKVLEAVTYRAGSVAEIAQRLSLPIADVGTALRMMEREGEIRSRSVDGSLVWGRA